jgi:hypothetical protein
VQKPGELERKIQVQKIDSQFLLVTAIKMPFFVFMAMGGKTA